MLEILKKRNSVRNYSRQPVEKEKTDKMLEAALLSPSSRNNDPGEFIVVDDSSIINKLSMSKKTGSSFLSEAPLVIAVIADTKKSDVWIEDSSIASIIIQLEAEALSLKSCWVQIRKRETADGKESEIYVREVLGIPANYGVLSLIGIGYPEKDTNREIKKLEHKKCRLNSYSNPFKPGSL